MKDFYIITKSDCNRCFQLKDWFNQNHISYTEKSIENSAVYQNLLEDPNFLAEFCIEDDCKFYLPFLYITKTHQYFHKHLFGIDGIRGHFLNQVLEIETKSSKSEKEISLPRLCRNELVEKLLKEYILALGICRSGGDLLYYVQIDKSINLELIAQFIAALSMFGEENLGKIERITLKGLEIEMSITTKNDLLFVVLFKPHMVQDYLDEEAEKGLDRFYALFKDNLDQNKTNRVLYESFDREMCLMIQNYLVRIGILECVNCTLEIPILREISQK
ncbi:hypothetical protein NEF87_002021 [Candidatus Lokiarchaeum ossiferum]|uniref:Uncharacterized protein n=1 Tax=Candidatus Lokiarchaeum ossiferum TaxID=2951803 RepID=A0ABY6HT61_9ARCH|nr:hypothetical protein NEF87_002021 [Candidatus Lokiarchaeum sp. B-35]